MVFFEKISLAPPDSILGLTAAFVADPRKTKVNLGAGIYKDETLKTTVLNVVKQAEALILETEKSKEYLPIDGDRVFIEQIASLIFGPVNSDKICGFQTPGGRGALRIGGSFLKKEVDGALFIPNPSWPNHKGVFTAAGFNVGEYPYYDFENHCIHFDKMLSFLNQLPVHSIVLLHAACHNPTGADLSMEQWQQIAGVCVKKNLLPFFDCAYQGFGRGIDEDVEPIRLFAKLGMEMLVAVSQSKNFSLYGERVGALYVVTGSKMIAENVKSRIKQIIRTLYSNPPMHGAKIVATILQDPKLRQDWEKELEEMRSRINALRETFTEALINRSQSTDFSYLKEGRGMFCFTGLNKAQVEKMIADFGVYMTGDGRINVCGLNRSNLDYVADAIAAVLR